MPPRRRRRAPVARRSTGNFGRTWRKDLVKAEDSLKRLRAKTRNSKVPNAVRGAAAVLAGAAAAGALTGYGYDTVLGVDTDIALGLVSVTLGVSMGKPDAILFAAGLLSKSVGEWTESKIVEMQSQSAAA